MAIYDDGWVKIEAGNCMDVLGRLEPESCQCIVTSPPYWGLRQYEGKQDYIWPAVNRFSEICDHEWDDEDVDREIRIGQGLAEWSEENARGGGHKAATITKLNYRISTCKICGAWRGPFGLEPSPAMYVDHTVQVLEAVHRVLRKDGVVFWNLGDSYSGSNCGSNDHRPEGCCKSKYGNINQGQKPGLPAGLKPKDLCLIPQRVMIAAQEAGWWVRSIIIWAKNNPMPESVKDRPTDAHEYIIMLTKSKDYFWDMEAVREAYTEPLNRWGGDSLKNETSKTMAYKDMMSIGYSSAFRAGRDMRPNENGRNLRSVWTFPTRPYPEAHFATFPAELPRRCIMAATSEAGNCAICGRPWARVVEKEFIPQEDVKNPDKLKKGGNKGMPENNNWGEVPRGTISTETKGWIPQCECGAGVIPPLVIDPFGGSGTVAEVAKTLGRRALHIDVSEEYCGMARKRVEVIPLPMKLF